MQYCRVGLIQLDNLRITSPVRSLHTKATGVKPTHTNSTSFEGLQLLPSNCTMARKNNRKSRRRVRSKPTERISWSNTERLQLLAYLDWCVQSCVKFEATAPGYLHSATGRHFSKERIRGKLYLEWKAYGECKQFKDLFEQGTDGLQPLEDEDQEIFYRIVAGMSPLQGARRTRSRSLGLAARSGTLSAPRSTYSSSRSREPNEVSASQSGNSNVIPERPRQRVRDWT